MNKTRFNAGAAGLAILFLANPAAPQQVTSPILTPFEMQLLVGSIDPGDNARLSAHFGALADRYAADARRHNAMAQGFSASPRRSAAANTAADHCHRLAELNGESAEKLRELAGHYERLSAGVRSTAPSGTSRFEQGAGASELTDEELDALAAHARTPAAHRALQAYFLEAARRYTADAGDHAAMAQAYQGTRIMYATAHCDRLVALGRDAAKNAAALAATHEQLASLAR
jgi:hypothetical protein